MNNNYFKLAVIIFIAMLISAYGFAWVSFRAPVRSVLEMISFLFSLGSMFAGVIGIGFAVEMGINEEREKEKENKVSK